jgi:hypothetical protein
MARITIPKRAERKGKSPFLLDKPTSVLPIIPTAMYTNELFNKSDKAVKRLKDDRVGVFQ